MLKIGDFSKLSYISIRMLRYYDQLDILKPSYIDESTNYRFYEIEQLETANMIVKLRSLGFTTTAIKSIIDDKSELNITNLFNQRMNEVQFELERLVRVSKEMHQLVKIDVKKINYNVVKKIMPKRTVISLRKTVSSYMDENELWIELYKEISKQQVNVLNDGYAIALFHDLEYKENNVSIEVQVTVDKKYKDTNEIQFFETDEVEVASVTFIGSYDKMPEVTLAALNWIELNNYELIQPTFNIYHISPAQDTNPDHWITESCFIIKERTI